MVPTKKVDKTPYELWYGKVPNLSYSKVWGCEALVKRDTPDKLQQRSIKLLLGFIVSQWEWHGSLKKFKMKIHPPSKIIAKFLWRFERTHRAPDRLCINVEAKEHSLWDLNEPTSYKAVMLDFEYNKLIDAMMGNYYSMMDNYGMSVVDSSYVCKGLLGVCGFFKKRLTWIGIIHTISCLVSRVIINLYEVELEERYSPVADTRAIRILISIAAFYDYEIWKMDVKTAFLNGYLDEDIYMVQPEGFLDPNHPRKNALDLNKTQGASTPKEVKRMQNVPYASAVGSIIELHLTAVKNILKYLRNTKDMFLVYGGNPKAKLRVDCYCDAGFETDRDDTKSQTGYVFILNGGALD
ncbi:retrotransposon protein, putative, ty1-copia subclass [Tanacetum coccineum]